LSAVTFFRHGQAGTRNRYDTLSPLGREQARSLGRYLAAHRFRFTAAFSGALERQRETAGEVERAYCEAGLELPEISVDPGWNEFDLDAVYRDVAPVLASADPAFHAEYEEMREQMVDEEHHIHRRWSHCDMMVLRAWVSGSVAVECETWTAFHERITGALDRLTGFGPDDQVAVFTSATPIGIVCGTVLGIEQRTAMRLTGSLYNSAYTTVHRRDGEWSLFSFNNIPHLTEEAVRSFR
jgi:broad specificity phosphatase PhoE